MVANVKKERSQIAGKLCSFKKIIILKLILTSTNRGRGGAMYSKKGKVISSEVWVSTLNIHSCCARSEHFLIVFAEDGIRQITYDCPISQSKAWCTAFEKELKNKSFISRHKVSQICIIFRGETRVKLEMCFPTNVKW